MREPRDAGSRSHAIRVAIVDDHPLMLSAVAQALGTDADIELVGQGASGSSALRMAREIPFDVLLLDLNLPDTDGITVLRRLRKSGCDARVIMLSCFDDETSVRLAVDEGACGYLTKQKCDAPALVSAVKNAYRGRSALSSDALTALVDGVRGEHLRHITDREREVWSLMANGLTNSEIAAALHITERTVKFHVGNVLRKTESRNRAEVVCLAFERGLMHASPNGSVLAAAPRRSRAAYAKEGT